MSAGVLLRGGRVIDPSVGQDGLADVRLRDGIVAEVGRLGPEAGESIVDAEGLVVAPGLIDVHVHLREPGHEWKETVGSGTAAAAAGGFTTIFCMPNTEPPLDSVAALEELARRTGRDAAVNVHPIATISEGRRGRRAVDYDALAAAGAVGFSDDGDSTRDAGVMREALRASARLGLPAMVHCEDSGLARGAMHDGDISQQLGVRGIPAAAEEIMIDRDLRLARKTGGWLHVCHVTTGRGAEAIEAAKRDGVRVTAEVMPHHLVMTDAWVAGSRELVNTDDVSMKPGRALDPDTKVNPPLRPPADARRLVEMLQFGVFDLIATDHAPHAMPEKNGRSFAAAAFGMSGSELALPTILTLVRSGWLSLADAIARMTTVPARLWKLNAGTLRPGSPADVVVFDADEAWEVVPSRLRTRSGNTPLSGMMMRGRVKRTFVGGDERYRD
jgi:dihydroorotase